MTSLPPDPPPGPAAGPPPPAPPPGWYVDPLGGWRWWDGRAWGVAAPGAAAGARPNQTLAVITHLGSVLGGFLLPLVIYLVGDERDRFLRHHAAESLNFQLTLLVAMATGFALFFVSFAVGAAGTTGGGFAFFGGFFVVWALLMVVSLGGLVLGILGAVRAGQGVWWRYPVSIRFVKGAAAPDQPAARAPVA